jgi:hypothetical protein
LALEVTAVVVVGSSNRKWSALDVADVPLGVVTVTSMVPEASAGATAVIAVSDTIVKLVAAVAPNVTALAPVKFVPVIVTTLPPLTDPSVALTALTVGAEAALYVK